MSFYEDRTVKCPECGVEQIVQIWNSLNVSLNPHEKSKLFDGEINLFVCESCGHKAYIPVSFLYHDMDRKFCVQYFPSTSMKKAEFLMLFNADGSMKISENVEFAVPDYMKNVQVVFSMDELVRYVLFREMLIEYHLKTEDQEEKNGRKV